MKNTSPIQTPLRDASLPPGLANRSSFCHPLDALPPNSSSPKPRPSAFGLRISDFALPLLVAFCTLIPSIVNAQPAGPAAQDPLMNLMLSQPKIDVEGPVEAAAVFDPPAVKPGEQSVYRVSFNALEASVAWSTNFPVPPGLELRLSAHGQVLIPSTNVIRPRTSFNLRARADRAGEYVVAPYTVMVYGKPVTVPAARLEVTANPPPSSAPPRLELEILATNIYVGQAVPVRVVSPGAPGGVVQGLAQVQINGEGMIVEQNGRQRIEVLGIKNGVPGRAAFTYETTLTPFAAGSLPVSAQGFSVGNRFGGTIIITGPATIPGGPPSYTLLDSDPVEMRVRPLPREGQLPGFCGAVGTFMKGAPALSTNLVRVGEALQVAIRIYGDSGVARLTPPTPPRMADWQVFVIPQDKIPGKAAALVLPPKGEAAAAVQGKPSVVVAYTLIPLSDEVRATPAIALSAFDPVRGVYTDLSIPPMPIVVRPGPVPGDMAVLRAAAVSDGEAVKEPGLGGLATVPGGAVRSLVPVQQQAWFPLVQLAPAVAFFALWGWDRRRRYCEQHPDWVRRRKARRALRRQQRLIERKVRSGDVRGFAEAAVKAMQIASAPHFPAEPEALVGGDVLSLLPEEQRAGSEGGIVRRFFAATDAARFAADAAGIDELPALQPGLAKVLQTLEEKLQ